jgi:hypothetical protein
MGWIFNFTELILARMNFNFNNFKPDQFLKLGLGNVKGLALFFAATGLMNCFFSV